MMYRDDPYAERANRTYIRHAMRQPLLSRELEKSLALQWQKQGHIKALHRLTEAHLRLVISLASRYRAYGLPLGDLIQEGTVGLMEAVQRYDTQRKVRFSTYATWWIRAAMQDYVLRHWSIVRIGTTAAQKKLFFNLRQLRAHLEKDQKSETMTAELRQKMAKKLNVSVEDIEVMEQRLGGPDHSLSLPQNDSSNEMQQDWLVDTRPSPEMIVTDRKDSRIRQQWLKKALTSLSERERTIINARKLYENAATLEEIGQQLHISKERVRQLESRALSKLRTALSEFSKEKADFVEEV